MLHIELTIYPIFLSLLSSTLIPKSPGKVLSQQSDNKQLLMTHMAPQSNGTWQLIPLPVDKSILKIELNGNIDFYKSWLVAKGDTSLWSILY